jgi:N-terminal barrel of NtMGAM and CtMGAM, maltase-glucoamylase
MASGQLHLKHEAAEDLGRSLEQLFFQIERRSDSVLRIAITDCNNTRWRIPERLLPGVYAQADATTSAGSAAYRVSHDLDPFSFEVHRAATSGGTGQACNGGSNPPSSPVFKLRSFAFKDRYLEFSTPVPEASLLMGLGEQTRTSGAPCDYAAACMAGAPCEASAQAHRRLDKRSRQP